MIVISLGDNSSKGAITTHLPLKGQEDRPDAIWLKIHNLTYAPYSARAFTYGSAHPWNCPSFPATTHQRDPFSPFSMLNPGRLQAAKGCRFPISSRRFAITPLLVLAHDAAAFVAMACRYPLASPEVHPSLCPTQ